MTPQSRSARRTRMILATSVVSAGAILLSACAPSADPQSAAKTELQAAGATATSGRLAPSPEILGGRGPAPAQEPAPAPAPAPAAAPEPAPEPAPAPPAPAPAPPAPAPAPPAPAPAPAPPTGGMPGPDNTGVPAGVQLTVHQGDLVITEPGTVIDGLDIHGFVDVRAANVTIRNSIIRGGQPGGQDSLVRSASDSASLTITDSELVSTVASSTIDGLRGWNITAERLDIHNVLDGAHFWGAGNVSLTDSWIHGILHFEQDPGWNGGPSHDDAIQIQSGTDYRITGNRVEGGNNAAIQLTQDAGVTSDVTISGNWLGGGACTVNLAQKDRGPLQGIAVTDNTFGDDSRYGCSIIRPAGGGISTESNVLESGAPAVVVIS